MKKNIISLTLNTQSGTSTLLTKTGDAIELKQAETASALAYITLELDPKKVQISGTHMSHLYTTTFQFEKVKLKKLLSKKLALEPLDSKKALKVVNALIADESYAPSFHSVIYTSLKFGSTSKKMRKTLLEAHLWSTSDHIPMTGNQTETKLLSDFIG